MEKITTTSLKKVSISYRSLDNFKNVSNFLIGCNKDNLIFLAMPYEKIS